MELKQLCEMQGISGREEPVRMAVYHKCVEKLGEENVTIDKMGNVIAHKAGRNPDAPHVMLTAHMDEVGFIVTSATEDGFLKIRPLGGVDPRVIISKRVLVGDEKLPGVIGATPIHLQSRADSKRVLGYDDVYVDIGAKEEIYKLRTELLQEKKAVIMISSDMPELIAMSNRAIVMRDGRIVGEACKEDMTQEMLLKYSIGGKS